MYISPGAKGDNTLISLSSHGAADNGIAVDVGRLNDAESSSSSMSCRHDAPFMRCLLLAIRTRLSSFANAASRGSTGTTKSTVDDGGDVDDDDDMTMIVYARTRVDSNKRTSTYVTT